MAFSPIASSHILNDEIIDSGFQYITVGSQSANTATLSVGGYQALSGNIDNIAPDYDNNYNTQGKTSTAEIAPDTIPQDEEIFNIASINTRIEALTAGVALTLPAESTADAITFRKILPEANVSKNAAENGTEINTSTNQAELTFPGDVNISINGTAGNSTGYKVFTSGGGVTAEPGPNSVNYNVSGSNTSVNLTAAPVSGISTFRIDNISVRAIDAEKTGIDDTNLCWAGTAANMLYWAGWGQNTGSLSVSSEDDLLAYYQQNFTDEGGWTDLGIEWFLDGQYSVGSSPYVAQLEKTGGGGFFPSITVSSYLSTDNDSTTVMTSLDSFLRDGDVCGLGVQWYGGGGHAITCWGFTYNTGVDQSNKSYYTGVWISDSDDNYGEGRSAPDITRYCPVSWSNADQAYILTYESGIYGYIDQVVGLAVEPGYNPGGMSFTLNVINMVSGETVQNGTQTVFDGGITFDNIINAAGGQVVSSGGIASGTVINSGGSQIVSSAGTANSTVVNFGGSQRISSSGAANSTIVNSGGRQVISSAGTAAYTVINFSGIQLVSFGGSANSTTINSGGSQVVSYGGSANATTVNSGGIQSISSGAAVSTIVNSGGSQLVSSGGIASNTILYNSGLQNVSSSGVVNSTTINSGGSQLVLSGGAANFTTINYGGQQYVSAGGTAGIIFQQAGAAIVTYTAAKITGGSNTRSDGHNLFSIISGAASNFLLENGGQLNVLFGQTATDTLVASGGQLRISTGGVANLTTINYFGQQYVSSGGAANSTIINSGGQQYISSSGVAGNTVVNAGGSMYVSSGGIASGSLTVAGGDVIADNALSVNSLTALSYVLTGAKISDVLVTVNSGSWNNADAAYSLNLDNTAEGSYILADGVDLTGLNNKTFSVTDSGQTVNLNVGSSYIFSNGDKLSLNFTDSIRDQLTAVLVAMPKIAVTAPDADAGEPGNDGSLRISRTGDLTNALTIYFNVGGTATSGSDYTLKNGSTILTGSVVIAAGQSYVDVRLGVIDDVVIESTETAIVNLAANAAYALSPSASATINIKDNDDIIPPTDPSGLVTAVTGKNVAFDWADSSDSGSGLKNYILQYASNDQFTGAVQSSISVSNANVFGLADGVYYWRVQAADNADNASAWVTGGSFTVDTVAPTVPASLTQTVTGSNVALDWSDATDATSGLKNYVLQYALNNQFSGAVQNSISVSDADVSGLADGVYYWRIQSVDNTGNASAWVTGGSFLIDSTAPVPTGLTQAVNGKNVAFDWADSVDTGSGLKNYTFEYSLNNQFAGAAPYSVTASNTNVYNLSDGVYYWRVQAYDNAGNVSDWGVGGSFAVDSTAPAVPSGLVRMLNGNSAVLTWDDAYDASSGVKQYQVELDSSNKFISLEYFKQVTDNQVSVGNLTTGTHYWRVRTQDNSGNFSAWSAAASFTVELVPPSVPGGLKQTVTGNSVALDWNDSTDDSGIRQYQFRVDNNSDFSSPEYTRTAISSQGTDAGISSGIYYWQVRAQDNAGNWSSWSSSSRFIVTPTDTAANDYKTAQDISNLDNWVGSGDAADVYKLTMTNAGTLTIGLTSLTGNADLSLLSSTGTVLKSSSNTGTTSEAINNVTLLAGTYYVKVTPGASVDYAAYTLTHSEKYFPIDTAANDYKAAGDISNLDNWVGFGDAADVYKLTMTNAGTLTLGLTGLTGNADLSLLSSTGTVLKSSSNTGTTSEAINNVALLAGTYYVKIAAGTSVNDASYTLTNNIKYYPVDRAANDYKTAQNISNLDNWVGFGDAADVYKLTMTNAGTLTLGLTGLTGNADLSLLSSTGAVLKISSNTGTTSEAINNVALLAGTYYVKVAAGTSVNDASYTLTNTIKYCPTDTAANDYKSAGDISNLDNWVGFGDAADFYKLTMTNAGTLTLGLTSLTGNADLSLLSSTGAVMKSSSNTGTTSEAINNVALLAGTYYVKVAAGTSVNDASYTLVNTVNYFAGDTYDKAGNTIAAAKVVDSPTQTGWVGFGDSDDYYRFDLTTPAQGTLRLYDLSGGNADLTLYDAKGTQLKKSANSGTREDTITSTLAAGTYYARITAVTGNIDYKLDFSKKDIVFGMLAS